MKSVPPKLWRQGDVLIQQIDALPRHAHSLRSSVLFEGEASGHQHRVKDKHSARQLSWRAVPERDDSVLIGWAERSDLQVAHERGGGEGTE